MFLEILTRHCCKRFFQLAANQASLRGQTSSDWKQTLIIDHEDAGIPAAQKRLADYAASLVGDYIWILDDDDLCTRPTLVEELRYIAGRYSPDVIMIRMDHGPRGILPDKDHWPAPPVIAHIGCSAYVVRREVWQKHAAAWAPGNYSSDYDFIATVWAADPVVYWHDVIGSAVQMIGRGKEPV